MPTMEIMCVCMDHAVLPPEIMCKSMTRPPADCKRQGCYFCSDTDDCTLTVERDRRFLRQHLAPSSPCLPSPSIKKKSQTESHQRELLKIMTKMLKCSSLPPQLMLLVGMWVGRTQFSLRGWQLELTIFQ